MTKYLIDYNDRGSSGLMPWVPGLDHLLNPRASFARCITLPAGFAYEQCSRAVNAIVEFHDYLRLRIAIDADEKSFYVPKYAPFDINSVQVDEAIELVEATEQIKRAFVHTLGGFASFTYISVKSTNSGSLFIILDHALYDDYALAILISDFEEVVEQIMAGRAVELGLPSVSFRDWAISLNEYLSSDAAAAEVSFWRQTVDRDVFAVPKGNPHGVFDWAIPSRNTDLVLSKEATSCIIALARAAQITIADLVLIAAAIALRRVYGGAGKTVALTMFTSLRIGPIDLDASRTVAGFSSSCQIYLRIPFDEVLTDTFRDLRAQLAAIPNAGKTLCWLGRRDPALFGLPFSGICINYVGPIQNAGCATYIHSYMTTEAPSCANIDTGELYGMARWPEFVFSQIDATSRLLLRLHFIELRHYMEGERVFDIYVNGILAIKSVDIYKEAGGRRKPLVKDYLCHSDSNGDLRVNLVSSPTHPGKAAIAAVQVFEVDQTISSPNRSEPMKAIIELNAGGPTVGSLRGLQEACNVSAFATDAKLDLDASGTPVPIEVYETELFFQDPAEWWPRITVNCGMSDSRLHCRIDSKDNMDPWESVEPIAEALFDALQDLSASKVPPNN